MKSFVEDFKEKKLEQFLMQEPIPTDDQVSRIFKKIVTSNYEEKVIKSNETTLVMFCSDPEMFHICSHLMDGIEFLDEKIHFKNVNFYFVDVLKNEFTKIDTTSWPNLILYVKGEKKYPKKYEMNFELNNLLYWLKTYIPSIKYEITENDLKEFILRDMSKEERDEF